MSERAIQVESIEVPLGERGYRVHVGPNMLDKTAEYIPVERCRQILIVTDRTIAELFLDRLRAGMEVSGVRVLTYVIPPGEGAKNLHNLEGLYEYLADHYFSRADMLVAFGGGVVGDLGGFAAATFKRGMDLVHIPTTLMSQVDSAIGGKTGINLPQGKNLAGAFYQPRAVIADTSLLDNLPERQFLSGWAEVLKYYFLFDGLLKELVDGMDSDGEGARSGGLPNVVKECVRLKVSVVVDDERDRGMRAILNYGHSLGHALEALSGYEGSITHGEAISIGMVFAAEVASVLGMCGPEMPDYHRRVISGWGLPISLSGTKESFEDVWSVLLEDKKNVEGLTMVLLRGIGRPQIEKGIERSTIRECFLAVGGK